MSTQRYAFARVAGACMTVMTLGAHAAEAEYVCMGMQRGQIAVVIASSLEEANKKAKAQWGSAGCYKK